VTAEVATLATGTADMSRRLRIIGYLAFTLIGWSGLLVPSLIRSIEHDFSQTDAGLGIFYFVGALSWATGGLSAGFLTERLGRRVTLPLAAGLLGLGLTALALAPSWPLFVLATVPLSLGGGGIDAGVNGLFLDLHPGFSGPVNMLHFFFSVGALGAPFVVGVVVAAGVAWPAIPLGSAVVALLVGRLLLSVKVASGRRAHPAQAARGSAPRALLGIPLLMLAMGIGCYVAAEMGTSNWLVRFLASAPLTTATASLSLFWGGIAAGRLLGSRYADRFDPVTFATVCALIAGIAGIAAVLVPSVPASIVLFTVAGLGQGPIYPMIMTVAGTLYPGRSGAVSGLLTGAGVLGGLIYPPVIGFISVTAGIAIGLLGAGVLALAAAGALVGAHVLEQRRATGRAVSG
jgi:FHS family glucose/mannose:H+ symporter-like MFS transporter